MPRKKRDFSREILPDPKYHDIVVTKTISCMMRSGKKSVAEKALYSALEQVQKKSNEDPEESLC